jgi:hypothetical protein
MPGNIPISRLGSSLRSTFSVRFRFIRIIIYISDFGLVISDCFDLNYFATKME